eukprot:1156093-Pelagomonas_calceolata.AAC.5
MKRIPASCAQGFFCTSMTPGMSRMDNFHTSRGVASLAQSNYLGTYQVQAHQTCRGIMKLATFGFLKACRPEGQVFSAGHLMNTAN